MKTELLPIALNETSYNVALLHKVLGALGLPVAERETAQRTAGEDTRSKVRALQAQLNLPPDDRAVLNAATIAAIGELLTRRGLVAASRAFTVKGRVTLSNGAVRRQQRLLAFDLDLRGVGVYRTVKTAADMDKVGGFEFLGVGTSDNRGDYEITFYDWQYDRAERKKADVVIYAAEEAQNSFRLIGRSRMVNSTDYADTGLVEGLDVVIPVNDQRTEYEQVMSALTAFLKESSTTLAAISTSSEQLAFTADELDLEPDRVNVAAAAEYLRDNDQALPHELLYGLGRQGIALDWASLYRKPAAELLSALATAVDKRIVRAFKRAEVMAFLSRLQTQSSTHVLGDKKDTEARSPLNAMLSNASLEPAQQLSFVTAVKTFRGGDPREFWSKYLPQQAEFQNAPKSIPALLLTQQFTLLSGDHQPLVRELQVERGIGSARQLLDLSDNEWRDIVQKAGVPDFVPGADTEEKVRVYVERMKGLVNAAFPTARIARMIERREVPAGDAPVRRAISRFLEANASFDFAASRVKDFTRQIADAAGENADSARDQLLRIQRVFQVSTTPDAMSALLDRGLDSAYSITSIPRKTFVKQYAGSVGGEAQAFAIHQRASHIATRAEVAATHIMEYAQADTPFSVMNEDDYAGVVKVLEEKLPNYTQLFGSPDICECEHCTSVYSAAAYFVDLLRFLWRGEPNSDGKTPLDMLAERRPDLLYLTLTCENTHTIIPYIDLANEVMEHYTASGSLAGYEGYDTGEATAEELRANAQNFNLEAYRKLKDAKYPFTLPYHQPIDVIRTYSDHLEVSRYEAMRAMNPLPDAETAQAIAAESVRMCEEEHAAMARSTFDGTADATTLPTFYGYATTPQLVALSGVPEFLHRSGLAYTDLVELVQTQFVNPYQQTLTFIEGIAAYWSIGADVIYDRLGQIEAGTLDAATDALLVAAIASYNADRGTTLTVQEFGQWVVDHMAEFRSVITLYEPQSRCSLETTELRTVESIYEHAAASGMTNADWSRIHRFVRLWRKLGWTLHETDLMLTALGESDITAATIAKLEFVVQLKAATKLPVNQLAALWGQIDSYGDKSLYRKLFLNKAVQQIDTAFAANAWGEYLQDAAALLVDHQSAILAAFRLREEDLTAILAVAKVVDNGVARLLDLNTDVLNHANLSTLYRHAVLAKALKMRVADFCELAALFDAAPFSSWDIQAEAFENIDPQETHEFYELALATKTAGFKAAHLQYILQGTVPPDSTLALSEDKARQAARAIRDAFAVIERDHPDEVPSPLTIETIAAKLALTFQPDIVAGFIALLDGSSSTEAVADDNLAVVIPDDLAAKYAYAKGSGRLTMHGVMTDGERDTLQALAGANATFQDAVLELYDSPENFVAENFAGIFVNLSEAIATLFDHPAQAPAATLEQRLQYVYSRFIPVMKATLRRVTLTQHIAALIGMTEAATGLLIGTQADALIADLSLQGFSASYFADAAWAAVTLERIDATIEFDWAVDAPDAGLPNDNFSIRWQAYLAPPNSGDYTLRVDVAGDDEVFKLYLDDVLVLEKAAGDAASSWEVDVVLNSSQMHRLTLEYSDTSQTASARLLWKTATTAPVSVPAEVAYPATVLDAFVARAGIYHRAAKFITGFELTDTELAHLMAFSADFANIDFLALTEEHWRRINDYTSLRDGVPQALALITDVFAAAHATGPVPTLPELRDLITQATAWDAVNLEFLVDTHFASTVDDFKNEIVLNRLAKVMRIVTRTGLSAQTIAEWGAVETDFDALNATAQLMKNTVKSLHTEEDWLKLAGTLSDKLRKHQQQGLIAYLLTRAAIRNWGATDADGLFEYFLIDVQMGACMDTSRVVQANSSVQMFVNRCLLNLESDTAGGDETGVSPGAIDKDRWEWMKNYRIWEANRKVFLYPENWLEPDWRNDRSETFRELESYLVQNDITDRSVEQALRNYLASLNELANPDVCGLHREDYDDGRLKYLHVFARTHTAPYKFYYRRWNEFRKWSAWEKVPVDIRSVESTGNDGDNSGVQLTPVVWKKRLFLFWPEFMQVQEQPGTNSSQSVEQVSNDQMSTLEPNAILEIRLAWSEYVDGKWTPKQVSKEYLREWPHDEGPTVEKDYLMTYSIVQDTQELTLQLSDSHWNLSRGKFVLSDIQSPVRVDHGGDSRLVKEYDYTYWFGRRKAWKTLELVGDLYLRNSSNHRLLPVDSYKGLDITLDNPFFFSDTARTYFVRPVEVQIIDSFREPGAFFPYLPGIVAEVSPRIPFEIPLPDPGDPMPEVIPPPFTRSGNMFESRLGDRISQPMMFSEASIAARSVHARAASRSLAATDYANEVAFTEPAFAGSFYHGVYEWGLNIRYEDTLEFHTFHHPYSGEYVKRLNQSSLPGLMLSDTALPSDEGSTFEDEYDPNFTDGMVQKPSDFAARTYYKENVCFDVYGANALYNWELFFHVPLYIATRLSKNGRFEEAMKWFHYIFDPTTDEMPAAGESATSRYWKVLPFKTTPAQSLEDWFRTLAPNTNPDSEDPAIAEWRNNPFDPHLIAANRPLAYMKHVVLKYVENLIAWGDFLFRQDTMESVNEALQIYVIANHILGPRPQFVPKRGEIQAQSYDSLKLKWDDFSNALVELENLFPFSSAAPVSDSAPGTSLLGVGSALYFCIPPNDKLLGSWDTVADRLYKIRHCQNIDGIERKLALFAPPIDPGALIAAASQGLSLGSILADLSSPPPIYRFTYLIQKANEFCSDVKALGSALLSALEKKDAEELGRLRAAHETQMLQLMTGIRERNVLDAKASRENLFKARTSAEFRLQHYLDLLGNDSLTVPAVPALGATLNAESQLPADTTIPTLQADVDVSLVDSGEAGVKLIPKEKEELDKNLQAKWTTLGAGAGEALAGIFSLFPQLDAEGTPLGVGAGAWWGGQNLGAGTSALARAASAAATFLAQEGQQAASMATFIRREEEWTYQANLAAREIVQLDKQVTSADIRIQVAEKELQNHLQQISNAETVELYLKDKFTNQELYQWLKEQVFAVYKQSYNLAYDMAKKAEKAYKYEIGNTSASFIQFGYWDSTTQGLVAGERLQVALRELEKSYLDENRRELELSKSISLARLNPLALIQLRETGKCFVSLPEELFDLDFRGHYFRRIKAVRMSIPCIAGPHTSVGCSLRLLNNSIRMDTTMNSAGTYEHENDEGLAIDDVRFQVNLVPVTAIAISQPQNDSGMFEFNFRDERYLPFERAGAISEWQIELSTDADLRQFDYSTISDVILHLSYTAREDAGSFKAAATTYIKDFIGNAADLADQPLLQLLSMRHEFPTEWHRFLHPAAAGGEQVLGFTVDKVRFPYFVQGRDIGVMKLEVFARCSGNTSYHLRLSYTNEDGDLVSSNQVTMAQDASYGGLNHTTLNTLDAGLNLEELDVTKPMSLRLKRAAAADFTALAVSPDEVEDLYLVLHYSVA